MLDLSGWNNRLEGLIMTAFWMSTPLILITLKIVFSKIKDESKSAFWQPKMTTMTLLICDSELNSFDKIKTSIKHEMVHAAQTYVDTALAKIKSKKRIEVSLYPPKDARTPDYKQHKKYDPNNPPRELSQDLTQYVDPVEKKKPSIVDKITIKLIKLLGGKKSYDEINKHTAKILELNKEIKRLEKRVAIDEYNTKQYVNDDSEFYPLIISTMEILNQFIDKMWPDFLIMKESTPNYKIEAVKMMLSAFVNSTLLKYWRDNPKLIRKYKKLISILYPRIYQKVEEMDKA